MRPDTFRNDGTQFNGDKYNHRARSGSKFCLSIACATKDAWPAISKKLPVKLDKPVQYQIYNAMNGVAVKFLCLEADIPNFKIIIKRQN